jgi:hypothetical protein
MPEAKEQTVDILQNLVIEFQVSVTNEVFMYFINIFACIAAAMDIGDMHFRVIDQ